MESPDAVLVVDGGCDFCRARVTWLMARLREPSRVRVVNANELDDAELAAMALNRDDVNRFVWWLDGTERRAGALAVAAALSSSISPWPVVGAMLERPPVSWFARRAYAVVARYRHRLAGGAGACRCATT